MCIESLTVLASLRLRQLAVEMLPCRFEALQQVRQFADIGPRGADDVRPSERIKNGCPRSLVLRSKPTMLGLGLGQDPGNRGRRGRAGFEDIGDAVGEVVGGCL